MAESMDTATEERKLEIRAQIKKQREADTLKELMGDEANEETNV